MSLCVLAGASLAGLSGGAVRGAETRHRFLDKAALAGWEVEGDVTVDTSRKREAAASLRIGPGGKVVRRFRPVNGAGRVSFTVYDEKKLPAKAKERRVGPRWGLLQTDGRILGAAQIYAPYLAGDKTYATTEYDGSTWFKVQYLGECRRSEGWHTWTFDLDPEKGLRILFDGKDVNAKRRRFDWDRTNFEGFVGVVMMGDDGKGAGETLWVEVVDVELGGAMRAKPTPPPPPPPVVPDKDPAVQGEPARLQASVAGSHPRLLFGSDDVAAMKAQAKSEAGLPFWTALTNYVPACRAPRHRNFLKDATDGQRQGLWRMPTVALHYVLTGEKASLENAIGFMKVLLDLEHWETGKELDSGMSAGNIMIGAALAYDWLYHDLPPDFREAFRRKLFYHARAMYHGGHLKKNPGTHYWQNDPQNNHRWHRNAGMALCILAASEGKPEENWILTKTLEELRYVAKWLPEDGTSHEAPTYMVFGIAHLVLALQASDRCLGTGFLRQPFFENLGDYMAHMFTPGLSHRFSYGDGGTGIRKLGYDTCLYEVAATHRQPHVQGVLDRIVAQYGAEWGWMGLVWRDTTVPRTGVATFPTTVLFDDLGLVVLREGWEAGKTSAMFKCGPLGGYRLNRFRNERNFTYINVAHDDPDANSFVIFSGGEFLAETDRYSKHKQSANHNTILVNGMGQIVSGRHEGQVWSQPGRGDMSRMAYLTAWKDAGDIVVAEGEASGAYPAYRNKKGNARPPLTRFRRTFVWVKGRYILVLDDIRAGAPVEIDWLLQAPSLETVPGEEGRYRLRSGDAACDALVRCDAESEAQIVRSSADHRGELLGWRQLRLNAEGSALRLASVYAPWGGKPALDDLRWTQDCVTFKARGSSGADTWTWAMAPDNDTPSELNLTREGRTVIAVGPKDKAPRL
jgi:hypothetical protein